MREAGESASNVEDAVVSIFAAGYGFYKNHLPLARAAFSVSWSTEGDNGRMQSSPPVAELRSLIAQQLKKGVARGELQSDGNEDLRGDMLFDCYLANYRQAIYYEWGLDALLERSREQIREIQKRAAPCRTLGGYRSSPFLYSIDVSKPGGDWV
jgi:hypothetical protein